MVADLNPRGVSPPGYRGRNLCRKLSPGILATYPSRWTAATEWISKSRGSIKISPNLLKGLVLANPMGECLRLDRGSVGGQLQCLGVQQARYGLCCHYIECREEFRRSLCYGIFHKGLSKTGVGSDNLSEFGLLNLWTAPIK